MARYTVTPWRTQADLLSVRQQLYQLNADGNDSRRHAVDRVMAWKVRGNLPHAVESTALLVDAVLHHDLVNNSIFSIRAVYSAAFTRFVTGFCDIGRNRERALEPSSMLEIARQIDMPPEFVALRHEATHEELPSVQRLVVVCGQALEWLWRVYWNRLEEPQVEQAAAMTEQQIQDEARRLFKEYRSGMRRVLKQKSRSEHDRKELVQRTSNACATLCKASSSGAMDIAEVLVTDRVLLPSDRSLGAPMDGAFILWDDMMLAISGQHKPFLPALIDQMIIAISQTSLLAVSGEDPESEAFYLWLMRIVSSKPWSRTTWPSNTVMRQCCLHPAYWTYRLGQALLESEADNDAFVETWSTLLEASAFSEKDMDDTDARMEDDNANGETRPGESEGVLKTPVGWEAVGGVVGWREAPMPLSAPIGMVR